MSQSKIKSLIIAVIAIAVVVVAAAIFFKPSTKLPKQVRIDTTGQPTMGNANAKVHIIAFEDLKCPNCMRFNTTLLPKVKKKFVDSGIAKYTMITLAFIPGSMPAANAARCLYKQNKKLYFPFVKYIYFHQPSEEQNWATVPTLLQFASKIKGVNKPALEQCLVKSPYTGFINKNLQIANKVMGGQVATPTLFVNGRIVRPLTMKRLQTLIDAAK